MGTSISIYVKIFLGWLGLGLQAYRVSVLWSFWMWYILLYDHISVSLNQIYCFVNIVNVSGTCLASVIIVYHDLIFAIFLVFQTLLMALAC